MATSTANPPSDSFVDSLFPFSEPQYHQPSAMLQAQALQHNASKARKRKVNNLLTALLLLLLLSSSPLPPTPIPTSLPSLLLSLQIITRSPKASGDSHEPQSRVLLLLLLLLLSLPPRNLRHSYPKYFIQSSRSVLEHQQQHRQHTHITAFHVRLSTTHPSSWNVKGFVGLWKLGR